MRRATLLLAWTLLLAASGCPRARDEGDTPPAAPAPADFAVPEPGTYALPPLGDAADGEVVTSDGERVRLHDLFGPHAVLLSFIYTQCTDAEGCPLATAVMHGVGARLREEPGLAPRIRLLSLSFDPARDTPDVMRRYGEGFQRDGLDWRFLTTESEAALAPLLDAYRQTRVAETDASGEETGQFAHLLRVFLIDGERRIRQVYSTSLLDADALVADVKTLLLEAETEAEATAASRAPGAPVTGTALTDVHRSGDDRSGYESPGYTTRSLPLSARRGRAADLLAHARTPALGLPPVPVPADNPLTRDKIELGRRLFFDRRLSANDTISCAMCHVPEQGFTSNEMATAVGIEGRTVRRNAPTIYNAAYLRHLFHDGRADSLEAQIEGPLLARNEMGNPSMDAVVEKIRGIDGYAEQFDRAFPGRGLDATTVGMAIASYERTLVSGGSPVDRYLYAGDEQALTPAAKRGLALFRGRAGCAACHLVGPEHALFTDDAFHDTGIGARATAGPGTEGTRRVQAAPGVVLDVPRAIIARVSEAPAEDLGRAEITGEPADRHRYRTPSLRNVALTAPYMHDGSLATLRDVVELYRDGGVAHDGLDPRIRPLDLSDQDVADLVAFLESLTGSDVETLVADSFAAPVGDVGDSEEPFGGAAEAQ
jgi:cytochrome c peroxidase